MEKLKPCSNPQCNYPEPKTIRDGSFGLHAAYVECPNCCMRGPEFSICSNTVLKAECAWDELPRQSEIDRQTAISAAQDELIEALEGENALVGSMLSSVLHALEKKGLEADLEHVSKSFSATTQKTDQARAALAKLRGG